VRGVAGQQQVAVAHGLGDEAAEAQHGLVRDGAFPQRKAVRPGHPGLEFGPDAAFGPAPISSSGSHWKYIRCIVSVRWLISEKPRAEWV